MSEISKDTVTENSVTTTVVKPEGSLATTTAEMVYGADPITTIGELLNSFDRNWSGSAKQLAEELLASKGIEITNDIVRRLSKSIGQNLRNNLIKINELLDHRIFTTSVKDKCPKVYKLKIAPKTKLSEAHEEIIKSQSTEHVNHPGYYQGKFEAIDVIEDSTKHLSGPLAFNVGNDMKYILRIGKKHPTRAGVIEDLEKSMWYVKRAIEYVKGGGRIFSTGYGDI